MGKETGKTGYDFHSGCLRNQSMYVKEQMGPSSIDITVDVYGHLVPGGNARQWTGSTTAQKFLTNLVWKQNGNVVMEIRLPRKKRPCKVIEKTGATRRSRTGDLLITNQLLYQLS